MKSDQTPMVKHVNSRGIGRERELERLCLAFAFAAATGVVEFRLGWCGAVGNVMPC
jgi:hypothetical protein